jgi:methylated-DNA-protein-cysteine methyltransferase-like protein
LYSALPNDLHSITIALPIITMAGTDFFERVYDLVRTIPTGRVTTYGAIARHIGAGRSARIVGYALNGVMEDMSIPCHRVVNRNGELSGRMHFPTPTMMRELLESEGVTFVGDRVRMEEHYWEPV